MNTSKTIWQKLLEVQKEVAPIKKTETNPYFNSRYFDINKLLEVLKPTLTEKGLVLLQPLTHEGTYLLLETRLVDVASGEIISTTTILPDGGDAQKQGSAITYFRRYMLQSMFSLEAEDDDANKVSQPVKQTPYQKKAERRRDPQFQENLEDVQIDIL